MRPLERMSLAFSLDVDEMTGKLIEGEACCCNWVPAVVHAGDEVVARAGFELRACCYLEGVDPALVHTYSYSDDANWTVFQPNMGSGWVRSHTFAADCFVRVCVRATTGELPQDGARMGDLVEVRRAPVSQPELPEHFAHEAERVCRRVAELRQNDDLVLLLVSDVHWSAGCPWDDTVRNLREVASVVHPDAVVQLGDLTDGLAPAQMTREIVQDLLADLSSLGAPLYGCVGNHDANYFRGNPGKLDRRQRSELYLGRPRPWYSVDFDTQRIRAIFLDSFEPSRKERYGFCGQELKWLDRTLGEMPIGWKAAVFSHVPLLGSMHVWSNGIRLGDELCRRLHRFEQRRGAQDVLVFVHGHNHSDQICMSEGFPIVSVGCTKFEDFCDHKPWGSVTPLRHMGTRTQDLWDVVLLNACTGSARFVRFGAGEERSVTHA